MTLTAQFHAKEPALNYLYDGEEKRVEANDFVRQEAHKWVATFYERLESRALLD